MEIEDDLRAVLTRELLRLLSLVTASAAPSPARQNFAAEPRGRQPRPSVARAGVADLLKSFLAECTKPDLNGRVPATQLYQAFCAWAARQGEPALSIVGFGRALGQLGVRRLHSNINYWVGLGLVAPLPHACVPGRLPLKGPE